MKLLIAVVFLYSSFSLAGSRVGEWAAYDYEETTATNTIKGTLLREIVEEKKMQSPSGKLENYIRVSEKLNFESENKEVSKWVLEKDYLNAFDLNMYMLKCRYSTALGEIEKVKVKAGQFTSCRVKDTETWIGVVPFQHVLSIHNDGAIFKRYELIKFAWKKKPNEKLN